HRDAEVCVRRERETQDARVHGGELVDDLRSAPARRRAARVELVGVPDGAPGDRDGVVEGRDVHGAARVGAGGGARGIGAVDLPVLVVVDAVEAILDALAAGGVEGAVRRAGQRAGREALADIVAGVAAEIGAVARLAVIQLAVPAGRRLPPR